MALMPSLVLLVAAGTPDLVLAALRRLPRLALDGDQEGDPAEHAPDRVVVRQLAGLEHAPEAQRLDRGPDLGPGADRRLPEGCPDGLIGHSCRLLRLRPPARPPR